MIFPFILLLTLAYWIYAERRLGFGARVTSGVTCIVSVGCTCYYLMNIVPRYERTFHKSSIRLAGQLMATGETERVKQAVDAYNASASTGSTYGASMKMWSV